MKHQVIALVSHKSVNIGGENIDINLPDGCLGYSLVFESKKKANEFYKNMGVSLFRVETDPIKNKKFLNK